MNSLIKPKCNSDEITGRVMGAVMSYIYQFLISTDDLRSVRRLQAFRLRTSTHAYRPLNTNVAQNKISFSSCKSSLKYNVLRPRLHVTTAVSHRRHVDYVDHKEVLGPTSAKSPVKYASGMKTYSLMPNFCM